MKLIVTHGLEDTYIEKTWKHAETEEIEDLAAGILGKAQEAQSIEDDLFVRAMKALGEDARQVLP